MMQFGACVLLDPFWNQTSLGIRCSRNYGEMFHRLMDRTANGGEDGEEQGKAAEEERASSTRGQ